MHVILLKPYRSFRRSGRTLAAVAIVCLTCAAAKAQVKVTLSDLFTESGLYYRAYANNYTPLDTTGGTAYTVPAGLIGAAGPDQFWDFSSGPKDRVFRYDYLLPADVSQSVDFPDATLVEQQTDESDQTQQWLFFQPLPGQGRKVYGYYADNPLFTPANVFVPPLIDFPDPITYGAEWTASTMYENDLAVNDNSEDGGGLFNLAQRVTVSSHFKVDAYGTILLPDEIGTFGDGLRIDEEVTYDFEVDFGDGQYDHVETDYTRNYYWVMPGRGIVAQLNSVQGSSPPPEEFSRATAFLRMFETNKKATGPGGGCTAPAPVTDLRIRVSGSQVLLSWTKVECANQYVIQYTDTPAVAGSWKPLGNATANAVWVGENVSNAQARYYRVVSMK